MNSATMTTEAELIDELRRRLKHRQTLWVQNPQTGKAQPIMATAREIQRVQRMANRQRTTVSRLLYRLSM